MQNLQSLLSSATENEILEFKEAKNSFDIDKLGKYFSALSNEANLAGKDKAYLLFGVRDNKTIVGTNISDATINEFKREISKNTSPTISFLSIDRIQTTDGDVLLCVIPAAPHGIPIAWKDLYYGRAGESLGGLNLEEIKRIINQTRYSDWSIQTLPDATPDSLSPQAIALARKMYAEKNPRLAQDIEQWDDETFLNNARLTYDGKITNATILLLGKRESEQLITPGLSQITWILKDRDGVVKDYEHFFCPLIISVEQVRNKIRNLTYRYMTDETIFPTELPQYDPYVIREALNNCIAHQDYTRGGRIIVQEHEDDYLIFSNCGDFLPGTIENVLKAEYSASNYRNPFLAAAMVNLNMIDTVGSGILKMYLAQKKRGFPLPDYDVSNHEVRMKLTGKVIDVNYTKYLLNQNVSLIDAFELDKKQKAQATMHTSTSTGLEELSTTSEFSVEKNGGENAKTVEKNCGENIKTVEKILRAIKENPKITQQQLSEITGLTRRGVEWQIKQLRKKNSIQRVGAAKGGHWIVL